MKNKEHFVLVSFAIVIVAMILLIETIAPYPWGAATYTDPTDLKTSQVGKDEFKEASVAQKAMYIITSPFILFDKQDVGVKPWLITLGVMVIGLAALVWCWVKNRYRTIIVVNIVIISWIIFTFTTTIPNHLPY